MYATVLYILYMLFDSLLPTREKNDFDFGYVTWLCALVFEVSKRAMSLGCGVSCCAGYCPCQPVATFFCLALNVWLVAQLTDVLLPMLSTFELFANADKRAKYDSTPEVQSVSF